MMAECPVGHQENLSHDEVVERLADDDFECREEGCSKRLSYPVDKQLWDRMKHKRPWVDAEPADRYPCND